MTKPADETPWIWRSNNGAAESLVNWDEAGMFLNNMRSIVASKRDKSKTVFVRFKGNGKTVWYPIKKPSNLGDDFKKDDSGWLTSMRQDVARQTLENYNANVATLFKHLFSFVMHICLSLI